MRCPFYCEKKYLYSALGLAVSSAFIGTILYFTGGSEVTSVPTLAPSVPSFLPTAQPSSTPSRSPSLSPSVPPTDQPSWSPTLTPTMGPTSSPTIVNLSSVGFPTGVPAGSSEDSSFYEYAPYLVVGIAIFVFSFAGAYGIREYRRVYLSVNPDNAVPGPVRRDIPHRRLPSPPRQSVMVEDKGVAV